MPAPFLFDVFLSHNAKDKPRVRRLAERLKAAGLRVWFDEWNVGAGDIIALKVDEGLEKSRVLLLCMSPNALASGWVALERSTAIHRDPSNEGRRFIPLLLADCELPETLRRYKYVDYREETEAVFAEVAAACGVAGREILSDAKLPTRGIQSSKSLLSEAALEILQILEHTSSLTEPALHVIRKPNPGDPRQSVFFVDEATASGSKTTMTIRTRLLQPAVDELRKHGYLDVPFNGPGTLVYEFRRHRNRDSTLDAHAR